MSSPDREKVSLLEQPGHVQRPFSNFDRGHFFCSSLTIHFNMNIKLFLYVGYIQTLALPEKEYKLHKEQSNVCKQFEKFFSIRNHQYKNCKNPKDAQFIDFDTFFKKDFEKFHSKLDTKREEKIMIFLDVDLEYDQDVQEKMKG